MDLAEIDDALAEVEKAGVKLQIGFNRRFDKSFRRVHEIVASGEIGRPAFCASPIVTRISRRWNSCVSRVACSWT